MLTVIIYPRSAAESLDRYRPLFQPFENNGSICFCFWDRQGTTLQKAIPELKSSIRGVKSWRAIVVEPMSKELMNDEQKTIYSNPFDYKDTNKRKITLKDHPHSLPRLSQMLGGVPKISSEYLAGETYKLTESELLEEDRLRMELQEEYKNSFPSPDELFLFKAQSPIHTVNSLILENDYVPLSEFDSSQFWYRNLYSPKTRFLTQTCAQPEHTFFDRDQFYYWITLLSISVNTIPTGSLEAYKLYTVQTEFDLDLFQVYLSEYHNRLKAVYEAADTQIQFLDALNRERQSKQELPDYRKDIRLSFQISEENLLYLDDRVVGLVGNYPILERPWFRDVFDKSVSKLRKTFYELRRDADLCSLRARYFSKPNDTELIDLDEYLIEHMEEDIFELEKDTLNKITSSRIWMKPVYSDLKNQFIGNDAEMKKRMFAGKAIGLYLFAISSVVFGFLPFYIYCYINDLQFDLITPTFGKTLLLVTLIYFIYLIYRWYIINKNIRDINRTIKEVVTKFEKAVPNYSEYLTNSCSYRRGKRFLEYAKEKAKGINTDIGILTNHSKHLSDRFGLVEDWLLCFNMPVIPGIKGFTILHFDFDIPPERNAGYVVDSEAGREKLQLPDGSEGVAPYPFVKMLRIERIPVYEQNVLPKTAKDASERWRDKEEGADDKSLKAGGMKADGETTEHVEEKEHE